ncbi:phospholipase D family protein [Haladaptatus sp. F3-133]|uniref:Phospholipase D family protein n=1 Tax=Halorutilus salinus TaxID=2487751 RepID=A0A9Q4C3F0_9EURY|nr:phospholipase D family protein [Halorutilus salinus]MCX2819147.1 phospholipase D family protein [Halorutilus salinus]
MDEWSTDITVGGFGNPAEMRWMTVRSWDSFTSLFENAVHLDAVTYCESPDLLLDLFEKDGFSLESLDIVVGNREEYQSAVNEVDVARRLSEYYAQNKLTVRLKNRKVIHAKLYRAVNPGDKVTLIAGSPNLSYNSWRNQTNQVTVFETDQGSKFDTRFVEWIEDFRGYTDDIFLEDLADRLEEADDEEERERKIELWVDNRDTSLTERGELHTKAAEELEKVGADITRTVVESDDPEEGDETVYVEQGEDGEILPENEDGEGDVTSVKTPGYSITLSTQSLDGGYVKDVENELKRRGADVGPNTMTVPVGEYTGYLKRQYSVPKLWIDHERVHLQDGEHHRVLTANSAPDSETVDEDLENIERYVETVDRWGETNNTNAVMAHMYEGIIYFLWSPFVNLYAESFYGSVTLDNVLQYLYIHGESDAGKDKFVEFCLRLISDDLVRSGADGDSIGKTRIRALRGIDTVFPFAVSDISKSTIEQIDTLRNYWEESWSPGNDVSYPTVIFTSNDSRPKDWFRNRTKMLYFDVTFPSEPEDENFIEAQRDLNGILNEKNHIFAYVSRRVLRDRPYENATATIDDVREVLVDLYGEADRRIPEYFPEKPANREYDIGKRKWKSARDRGDVTFERNGDHLIAEFDLEQHEVWSYRKILPTKARPDKQGRKIVIRNPDHFWKWIDQETGGEDEGFLSRFF